MVWPSVGFVCQWQTENWSSKKKLCQRSTTMRQKNTLININDSWEFTKIGYQASLPDILCVQKEYKHNLNCCFNNPVWYRHISSFLLLVLSCSPVQTKHISSTSTHEQTKGKILITKQSGTMLCRHNKKNYGQLTTSGIEKKTQTTTSRRTLWQKWKCIKDKQWSKLSLANVNI